MQACGRRSRKSSRKGVLEFGAFQLTLRYIQRSRFCRLTYNYYARDGRFEGQSELLTLFSGDAFNPSLESSVTKGLWRPVILWCLWAMIWIAGELWCQLETTG
jgi:hypothetical protein